MRYPALRMLTHLPPEPRFSRLAFDEPDDDDLSAVGARSAETVSKETASLGLGRLVKNHGRDFRDESNPMAGFVPITQAPVTMDAQLGLVSGRKNLLRCRRLR